LVDELPDRALRRLILRFDGFQRRRLGVIEFCDDPDCVLRIRLARAARRLELGGSVIEAGEPILELHLWNERLPRVPPGSVSLAPSRAMYRAFVASLRLLARRMQADPQLARLRAVAGSSALFAIGRHPGGVHAMERLGFTVLPYRSSLGRFGEFWENFYSWWIIWAYNPGSLWGRPLLRLRRSELWMLTEEFMRCYAGRPASEMKARSPLQRSTSGR
jgi:hypothetical protein